MLHTTAPILFESSQNIAVQQDPANQDWLALITALAGPDFNDLARRYYLALYHFRRQSRRPVLPGQVQVVAAGKQQALLGMLDVLEQRKETRKQSASVHAADVFIDFHAGRDDEDLPPALRDFTLSPPPLSSLLLGAGRPPCDALCLLRAFLVAPLLGIGDAPMAVYRLLRSNPTFAHSCGFLGRGVMKQPGELTSRRLPSRAVCEEFSEVMTRYGLWHHARLEQVRDNLATGVIEVEDTVAFDTTHVVAHSHCDNVVPLGAKTEPDKKPKHRKVPRMRKHCYCGHEHWETCEHPWVATDQGAAVVVKGATRIYWAHKASVASFGDSEIPIDVRVCQYAAESDGNTLVPHLESIVGELPDVAAALRFILADDAYRHNHDAIKGVIHTARLLTPVHGKKARAALAEQFAGIDHFTPSGIPMCQQGHRFELRGRDITNERFIWAAPDDEDGHSVCACCPLAAGCMKKGGQRHIRVKRREQPQIDWDHPQHSVRNRTRYHKRTGVERAIKRLKVDLLGEHLTHRDSLRVQVHLDRKLLTLHLLLAVAASP